MKNLMLEFNIENPVDSYDYRLNPFPHYFSDDFKIKVKQVGGSDEVINHKIKDGFLYINTPIWAVNPKEIKVKAILITKTN